MDKRGPSDRVFGFVMAVLFAGIAIVPFTRGKQPAWWAAGISALVLLVAIAQPRWLHSLNRFWMKIAEVLSRIANPIVMGLLFFGVFTPVGLVMRLVGKSPMRLKEQGGESSSYWIRREPEPPQNMVNQF